MGTSDLANQSEVKVINLDLQLAPEMGSSQCCGPEPLTCGSDTNSR